MSDVLLLVAALLATQLGMGWLALAMEVHWQQVRDSNTRPPRMITILKTLGYAGLASALLLCLAADTATMAVLVWMMLLAISSITIAFVLSMRPSILAPLVAWIR